VTATPDLATLLAQLARALTEQHHQPAPEPRPLPERVLLTVDEAAKLLGVGKTKAYELVKSGELGSVQIGRLRRIHRDAITTYAAQLVSKGEHCVA
jgi:excisionase family DNA binding protein